MATTRAPVAGPRIGRTWRTERSIQVFRLGCLAFAAFQTVLEPGDSLALSWVAIVLLAATAVAVEGLLRARSGAAGVAGSPITLAGRLGMAGDTLTVALVLANNQLASTGHPVQSITLLLALEGAIRWGRGGGALMGLLGGLMAAAWTFVVHHNSGDPLPLTYLTFRVAVVVLVGYFVGRVVSAMWEGQDQLEGALVASREAHRRLAASEQRYRSLFERHTDAVYSLDLDGRYTEVNPAVTELTGLRPHELVGNTFHALIEDADRVATVSRFRAAAAGDPQEYECTIVHRDGHLLDLQIINLPIVVDDEIVGVFGIAEDVTDRKRQERELVSRAEQDPLTGLPNRRSFEGHLERRLRAGRAMAVLFIDLDNFKEVNDRFGHASGDELLVLATDRLLGVVRDGDLVARLGGDEFCVLLGSSPHCEDASILGERVVSAFADHFSLAEGLALVTASVGAACSRVGETAAELLARADRAMYLAKRMGRNQVATATNAPADQAADRADGFELELERAVEVGPGSTGDDTVRS